MDDKEKLKKIKNELAAILEDLKPRVEELVLIHGYLEDLINFNDD